MTWPVINLRNANAILALKGLEIKEHCLDYYWIDVAGTVHSNKVLIELMDELMKTYFIIPEARLSLDVDPGEVDPDFAEWQYLSEKRHVDAGIL